MKLNSLKDLSTAELYDLFDAEEQLIKALPKMAKQASSEQLRNAFQQHLETTKTQHDRLKEVFSIVGVEADGHKCQGMAGLIKESDKMMKEAEDPAVKDAALIAAAQRVEHYEIAGYGTVRTYAEMLGFDQAAKILQQTLEEESRTDEQLTHLAVSGVNQEAVHGSASS